MRKLYTTVSFLISILMLFSCVNNNNSTEKEVKRDKNIINVKDQVKEIHQIDDLLISSSARLYTIDDYLIVNDHKTYDMYVHLFNKNSFDYIVSAMPIGQGPGEITRIGHIGVNEKNRELYVSDHGKNKIFNYPLDSILNNEYYFPEVKREIDNIQFPSDYEFINDTLSYARIIEPTGNVGHEELLAKWNMQTGEVNIFEYQNPKVKRKRIKIAVSEEYNTLVECYHNMDLITIMDLDGNLKYNIYGPNWNSRDANRTMHYRHAFLKEDKIIASYSGEDLRTGSNPTKLFVFDINGNYLKAIDVGYRISDMCYDDDTDRLIMVFDDVIQFGYLELRDILD